MSEQHYICLKIFVASPGDVEKERKIAFQVIDDLNEIFGQLKRTLQCRLELEIYAWEGHVHPDLGLPQNVIAKQIPIEDCDIFIAIFWQRFGTPTETFSPADGHPYLSGTESEIDEAIHIRKRIVSHPKIMLYQKTDKISARMTGKQIEQLGKLSRYFEQFEPQGENPALIGLFRGKDFEKFFRGHLLQSIDELLSEPSFFSLRKAASGEDDSDPFQTWMESRKLAQHPFPNWTAEHDPNLQNYFVRQQELQQWGIKTVLEDDGSWLIYGKAGSGKTALRRFLASRSFPAKSASEVICVELDHERFNELKDAAAGDPDRFTLEWIRMIVRLAGQAWGQPERISLESSSTQDVSALLSRLREAVHQETAKRLLFLVDPFFGAPAGPDPVQDAMLLAPLIAVPPLPGIGLRFFFPQHLKTYLDRQILDLGHCKLLTLDWNEDELMELIRKRMQFVSNRKPLYERLGELCEPKGGLDGEIDQVIARMAEGRPRAVMWLAHRLIQVHCRASPIPFEIPMATWEQVQLEWYQGDRERILGPQGQKESFWVAGKEIKFKDQTLKLTTRSKKILRHLIEDSGLCTPEALMRSGWGGENLAGISREALREAVRRLKIELKEKNMLDARWIKTIHGQGYMLEEPHGAAGEGSDAD